MVVPALPVRPFFGLHSSESHVTCNDLTAGVHIGNLRKWFENPCSTRKGSRLRSEARRGDIGPGIIMPLRRNLSTIFY